MDICCKSVMMRHHCLAFAPSSRLHYDSLPKQFMMIQPVHRVCCVSPIKDYLLRRVVTANAVRHTSVVSIL